jgi:hypothetical protein
MLGCSVEERGEEESMKSQSQTELRLFSGG